MRPIIESDIPAVIVMGKAMHHESAYRELVFSDEKVEKLLYWFLSASPDMALSIVAVNDVGEICGMMAAQIVQHYFSDDYIIQDYLLYVRPEDRGSSIASRLIAKFLEWGKEKKEVKMIMCGVSTEIDTDKAVRLYEHFDFHIAGALMRRNP